MVEHINNHLFKYINDKNLKIDMESSEQNKDFIGMNRRKKFIQFPELVDPKKQWEDFTVNLRKNNRMVRIDSKRKDRIKSKVWKPSGIEIEDPNVIFMIEAMVKKMKIRNAAIKAII